KMVVRATWAAGLALTLLASSCTPATPAPSGSPRSSGAASHLQLIEAEDAQTLDPTLIDDPTSLAIGSEIFQGLTRLDQNQRPVQSNQLRAAARIGSSDGITAVPSTSRRSTVTGVPVRRFARSISRSSPTIRSGSIASAAARSTSRMVLPAHSCSPSLETRHTPPSSIKSATRGQHGSASIPPLAVATAHHLG